MIFYRFYMILHGCGKILENILGHFGRFLDNIWYVAPWNINIHIQKMNLLQRDILGARFWASKSNFWFSFFRASGQNFERPTEISNVRPEFRTRGKNSIKNNDFWTRTLQIALHFQISDWVLNLDPHVQHETKMAWTVSDHWLSDHWSGHIGTLKKSRVPRNFGKSGHPGKKGHSKY